MTDTPRPDESPFDSLHQPIERREPRPRFARDLRASLVARLGLDDDPPPTIALPDRRITVPTTDRALAPTTPVTATIYLTVADGPGAIDWYVEALGAVEAMRVVGDDGMIGHAELTIGTARIMLSSEYPEMGVVSPTALGGTPFAIHLDLPDVDAAYERAVAAGATAQMAPADQPHGARHGSIIDPYGHRWMLSQQLETFDIDTYADRSEGTGFTVQAGPGAAPTTDRARNGGLWSNLWFDDCLGAVRYYVDVLGFEEVMVVVDDDDPTLVVHSELRWPEGGIVQLGNAGENDPNVREAMFVRPAGEGSLYVITDDPRGVHDRLVAAGVEIVLPFEEPHYDPGGGGFTIRDLEGNLISFGRYGGPAD